MLEVAETLRATGVEPLMAVATARRLLDAASHGLKRRFEDAPPETYHEAIRALCESISMAASGPAREGG